ncbi:MAG: hypothetical protein R2695_07615 [Acidimicrobiales bacterium]
MVTPPLVAWMNPLPLEIAPALRNRRRAVAEGARGRVLDLGGWADHLDAYPIGAEVKSVLLLDRPGDVRSGSGAGDPAGVTRIDCDPEALSASGHGPFDTIVSLIRTPLVADLDAYIATLTGLLTENGILSFLEPVRRHGRLGRMLSLGGKLGRVAGGLHLDRDLPAELRARGLVVTDLTRFEVPSLSAPLRPFVQAAARWPVSPPGSAPS